MDLASYRKSLGLTQAQVAQELGLRPTSKGWICEIERGGKPASLRLALKIEQWSRGKVAAASVSGELAALTKPALKQRQRRSRHQQAA